MNDKMKRALAMLDDIPDDQLATLAMTAEDNLADAREIFNKTQAAVLKRMQAREVKMIAAGKVLCERTSKPTYSWDGEAVAAALPSAMYEGVIERVTPDPIPTPDPFWQVKSTVRLNGMITKLGDSQMGTALLAARTIGETGVKVVFKPIEDVKG